MGKIIFGLESMIIFFQFHHIYRKTLIMKKYIKIGQLNNPDFPLTDWNVSPINLWEYFEEPKNLTSEEIKFVNNFVDSCGLDLNGEDLLEVTMRSHCLKNFVVHILRYHELQKIQDLKSKNQKK